jgi:uncharacterized protein with HEPN domain
MPRRVDHVLCDILEAIERIESVTHDTQPEIPWPSVRGIGNVMRHEYDGLSDPIIWRVVTDELPRLKQAILDIRRRLPS